MISKLFSTNFWFYLDPNSYHFSDFFFLVLGGILLISFFASRIYIRKTKDQACKAILIKSKRLFFWIGLLLVLWFWFRHELITTFGNIFVATLITLAGIAWAKYIHNWYNKMYKKEIEDLNNYKAKAKYL